MRRLDSLPVRLAVVSWILILSLDSCAYYNTFYNAEQYFDQAQQLTRENQSETISRDEINLYSKSIEKSKKLLQRYPDSKYRDDAQFLIAKAYYYKGDYLLAKRYFDDLALNYSNSPYVAQVPLWMGRCLVKVGDLEMARHEASRILKGDVDRALQADALLLMGEIAVEQDSLQRAEDYLEQVIDRSPDGYTKAQAQFQVGKMRENKKDYEAALEAYRSVAAFRPSESLKVEAIIRQTSMLKALNRDEDAIEMISEMLVSDKFVDIRGQLEVELGKLFLATGALAEAESKFLSILETYARQEEAAEASFYLGELKLTRTLDYKGAKEAYQGVKTQSARSPLVTRAAQRVKQIDRYTTIQFDFTNLQRQLAGLKPLVKGGNNADTERSNRSSKSRGRGRSSAAQTAAEKLEQAANQQEEALIATVEVLSLADSIRIQKSMDENRYALAEYLLFEFGRLDSALTLLDSLEQASPDTSMKQQSAYMRFYARENIQGDAQGAAGIMAHIQEAYPAFFKEIHDGPSQPQINHTDPMQELFTAIARLFEQGDHAAAEEAYAVLYEDSTLAPDLRARACFNTGWLDDHFLFDREAAVEAYQFMVSNFADHPLSATAQKRLKALTSQDPPAKGTASSLEGSTNDQDQGQDEDQDQDQTYSP